MLRLRRSVFALFLSEVTTYGFVYKFIVEKCTKKYYNYRTMSEKKGKIAMIGACALGAEGVMFVPAEGEKTLPRMMIRRSNDNYAQDDTSQQ